jgi:hypothetical protein
VSVYRDGFRRVAVRRTVGRLAAARSAPRQQPGGPPEQQPGRRVRGDHERPEPRAAGPDQPRGVDPQPRVRGPAAVRPRRHAAHWRPSGRASGIRSPDGTTGRPRSPAARSKEAATSLPDYPRRTSPGRPPGYGGGRPPTRGRARAHEPRTAETTVAPADAGGLHGARRDGADGLARRARACAACLDQVRQDACATLRSSFGHKERG